METDDYATVVIRTLLGLQENVSYDTRVERGSSMAFRLAWFLPISVILWLVSIIGNGAVLICVFRDKKLHRPSYCMVAALSLADISYTLFGFAPMTYGAFVHDSVATCDPHFKFMLLVPGNVAVTASFLTILCLQFERYCSLAFPLFHRRTVTNRRALLAVVLIWIFSAAWTLVLYIFSVKKPSTMSPSCPPYSYECGILVIIVGFCGLVFLSCTNVRFLILLRRRFRNRASATTLLRVRSLQQPCTLPCMLDATARVNNKGMYGDHRKSNPFLGVVVNQASISVCIVVIFFIFCWLPLTALCLLETIAHRRHVDRVVLDAGRNAVIMLFTLNGAINPVVYARKNPHLRIAFWKLIGKEPNRIDLQCVQPPQVIER